MSIANMFAIQVFWYKFSAVAQTAMWVRIIVVKHYFCLWPIINQLFHILSVSKYHF